MRRAIVVVALVFASACSSSKGAVAPTTSANLAATTSGASPATLATSTTPSATVASTTTASATKTSSTVPPTAAPTTVNQLIRCETSSTTTGGLCVGITVPLPPDADEIIAAYLAFAKKHLEVQSNPDQPDWAGLNSLIVPKIRAEARAEIEEHFKRGEILNVAAGVTFEPRLGRVPYPNNFYHLVDCRADGSYWSDRTSGLPVAGAQASVSNRPFFVDLDRSTGQWLVAAYQYASGTCR